MLLFSFLLVIEFQFDGRPLNENERIHMGNLQGCFHPREKRSSFLRTIEINIEESDQTGVIDQLSIIGQSSPLVNRIDQFENCGNKKAGSIAESAETSRLEKLSRKNCNEKPAWTVCRNSHEHTFLLKEATPERLRQIIHCFPFPSPKPSPQQSPELPPKHRTRRVSSISFRRHDNERSQQQRRIKEEPVEMGRKTDRGNGTVGALHQLAQVSADTMAITALPLDCWLKERLKNWVQLSGHAGTIVPATDRTLWKLRTGTDFNEANAYEKLRNDIVCLFVPKFYKEIKYRDQLFIEIEDLTSLFTNPAIIDIKMGTRTFLEAEVTNPVKRKDLYQKMIKLDPTEPTDNEHADCAITKLRYMQFRERESSTALLGFRIEAAKMLGEQLQRNYHKVQTRDQVLTVLCQFIGSRSSTVHNQLVHRLIRMRSKIAQSDFFRTHEVIGSSVLLMHDLDLASAWMIDFAKSIPMESGHILDHRTVWSLGNHEDGYLTGLDNLIQILEDARLKELPILNQS